MAQRKENFYNPLDFEKDVAIGITLPFGKNKGLFSLSYSTEEQAISNLKNLLLNPIVHYLGRAIKYFFLYYSFFLL